MGIILTVVAIGSRYVRPSNWHPFLHKTQGWKGIAEGAAHIFFAYIGFDSISTHAEEARNPRRDLAIGILGSLDDLHDPLRRGLGGADGDGSV